MAPESKKIILNLAYNKSDTTTGALQFVDGITFFYSQFGDKKNDVMLMSQSTTALPERLTQVSLNPHVYTYLDQNCGNKELKYFAKARILQALLDSHWININKTFILTRWAPSISVSTSGRSVSQD